MNRFKMNGTLVNDVEMRNTKKGDVWFFNKLDTVYGEGRHTYINFKVFGSKAQMCKGLKAGAELEIEGHLESEFINNKYWAINCFVEDIKLLGNGVKPEPLDDEGKKDWQKTMDDIDQTNDDEYDQMPEDDDELPF